MSQATAMPRILGLVAGLFGAAGTALAAVASHGADPRLPAIAAAMLLVHAPALLALGLRNRLTGFAGAAGMALALGVAVFAGDLAARHFLGARLFPGSAPIGGALTIGGWLGLGLASLLPGRAE